MLPLVVFPGAGSELYRGLGSVVVGGLTMSAILTLLLVPPLLRLTLRPPAEATEAVAQAAE
jgi:HAE1 family hydrophobic/amphiphilic exporter-1